MLKAIFYLILDFLLRHLALIIEGVQLKNI
jgi:hypothetical protein